MAEGPTLSPSTSPPAGRTQKEEETGFAALIRRAHQKWSHRGIVEIDARHRLYNVSRCIQMGLRSCIRPHPTSEVESGTHQTEDYLEVTTQTHFQKDIKQRFEFRCCAPKIFASLRALVGVTEDEYLKSLAPVGLPVPYLEFITSSKSGMIFFLSNNKAFVIKTEKAQDVTFLTSQFLRRLVCHFHDFPHSLLVKIVGCYYIKMSGSKGVYFSVMQSVFFPDERITERYDLKGCSAGRYVKPLVEGIKEVIVLKDNNFDGRTINIGAQASWFRRQVDIDSRFLEEQGIMDYSLLLGIQKLHADEKTTSDKLADVVSRARRSIKSVSDIPNKVCPDCGGRFPTWHRRSNIQNQLPPSHPVVLSPLRESDETDDDTERTVQEILDITSDGRRHASPNRRASGKARAGTFRPGSAGDEIGSNSSEQKHGRETEAYTSIENRHESKSLPGMVEDNGNQPNLDDQQIPATDNSHALKMLRQSPDVLLKGQMPGTGFCQCTGRFQIDQRDGRNLRLLPDTVNPLHVIDGGDQRYFVGIIDVLTQYGVKKRMENLCKILRYPTETFSTVKAEHYARRFRELCRVKTEPEKGPAV